MHIMALLPVSSYELHRPDGPSQQEFLWGQQALGCRKVNLKSIEFSSISTSSWHMGRATYVSERATRIQWPGCLWDNMMFEGVVKVCQSYLIPINGHSLSTDFVILDGLVQKWLNSSTLAMELRLSCISPSIYTSSWESFCSQDSTSQEMAETGNTNSRN